MTNLILGALMVLAVVCLTYKIYDTYHSIKAAHEKYDAQIQILNDIKEVFAKNDELSSSLLEIRKDLELTEEQSIAFYNALHASMSVNHYYTSNTVIGNFDNQKDVYKEVVSLYNKAIEAEIAFYNTLKD